VGRKQRGSGVTQAGIRQGDVNTGVKPTSASGAKRTVQAQAQAQAVAAKGPPEATKPATLPQAANARK